VGWELAASCEHQGEESSLPHGHFVKTKQFFTLQMLLIVFIAANLSQTNPKINGVSGSGWEFTKLLMHICNIFLNFKVLLRSSF